MTNREVRLNTGFGVTAIALFVSAGLLLVLSLVIFAKELREGTGDVRPSLWLPVLTILIYGPLAILLFRLQAPVTLDPLRGQLRRRGVTVPFSAIDRIQFYSTRYGYGMRFSASKPSFAVRATIDSTFRAALTAEQWRGLGLMLAGSRVQNAEFSSTREQFSRKFRAVPREELLRLVEEQGLATAQRPRWIGETPLVRVIRGDGDY